MKLDAGEIPLSDAEFARIRSRVYGAAGIALTESKRSLVVARLARIVRQSGFGSFTDYLDHLEQGGTREDREAFVNALTTNLTRFFREEHHFTHLIDYVAGIIAQKSGSAAPRRLRIWSAGCSTGQEPYTIALSLLSALPELKRWDFRILATDIDTAVLAKGAARTYPAGETGELTPPQQALFERGEDGRICVPDAAASLVSFKPLNLLAPWPMKGPFDAIFCRNVTIYFDRPTQLSVFERFRQILVPAGMLYIGHSENMASGNADFRLVGKTVYQARTAKRDRDAA